MIVKVCGIKTESNIRDISALDIDMIGLNFYPPSVRYVDDTIIPQWYDMLDDRVSRVGVFVNMAHDDVFDFVDEYRLDYVQLHGDESPQYAQDISKHIPVIKVFRIDENFNTDSMMPYEGIADFYLLDTATKGYGGSGHKFNWDVLDNYMGGTNYMLSGGIGPEDVDLIKAVADTRCIGVDINSKFESSPGVKEISLISDFIASLKMK